MILAGFNIAKFLAGFAFWKGEKIGKIIFYAVLIITALCIYHKVFFAKTQVTNTRTIIQRAQNVTLPPPAKNGENGDAFFCGVKLWRLKIGIRL